MKQLSKQEWIGVVVAVVVVAFFMGGLIMKSPNGSTNNNSKASVNEAANALNTGSSQGSQSASGQTIPTGTAGDQSGLEAASQVAHTGPTATVAPATKLAIKDVVIGKGIAAKAGDTVEVNYVGKFTNGKVFDSSASHGQTFSFVLGKGMVIKGWDEGLVGMKEGGKRSLIIPPQLGYGPKNYGPIPGNSTLLFDVELIKVTQGK